MEGNHMYEFQKGVLSVIIGSYLLHMFLSLTDINKRDYWEKWNIALFGKDKNQCYLSIVLKRVKKLLLVTIIIGILSLVLSIFIHEKVILPTFIIMLIIFILFISLLISKSSLRKNGKD